MRPRYMVRGFRRLVVVLSVAVLIVGVWIDTNRFTPSETLQIHLRDGRTVDTHPALGWRRSATTEQLVYIVNTLAPSTVPATADDIVGVDVIRGVLHEWWDDAEFTRLALVIVAALWTAFFASLWIARGFAPPSRS